MPQKETEEGKPQSQILWGGQHGWNSPGLAAAQANGLLCCFESLFQVVLCTDSYGLIWDNSRMDCCTKTEVQDGVASGPLSCKREGTVRTWIDMCF